MWPWKKSERRRRRGNIRRDPLLMVDARLLERRRERNTRVGLVLLLGGALFGLVWVGKVAGGLMVRALFTENDHFRIRTLDLRSDVKLNPALIREYAGLNEGANLFRVDVQRVQSDLQRVPVVKSVVVGRQLPDTLVVRITERMPIARWGRKDVGLPLAMDREGFVLGPSSLSPGLPVVYGLADQGLRPGSRIADPIWLDVVRLLESCDNAPLSAWLQVSAVNVADPRCWVVRLANNERVLLAREQLDGKLLKLAAILKSSADQGLAVDTVDLTVNKNVPVTYRTP